MGLGLHRVKTDFQKQNSTPTSTLRRTSREIHYPPSVDTIDSYVLLVHQGMIEDVFLQDLRSRGIEVTRNSPFIRCTTATSKGFIETACEYSIVGKGRKIRSKYIVGCDGAHSQVRKSMPGVNMIGKSGKAAWGVLDGRSCSTRSIH